MAGEIQLVHNATAKTLYALVFNATGSVWQTTTGSFVAYSSANLANYTVAMTEKGTASRWYVGNFPAAAAGLYRLAVYERAGASAAEGDPLAGVGALEWDGSAVVPLASRLAAGSYVDPSANVAAIKAKTDALTFTTANKVDAALQSAGDFPQAAADKVWASPSRTLTAFGFAFALDLSQTLPTTPAAGSVGEALKLAETRLDVAVGTRLAATGYTAPDNAGIGTIQAKTDQLAFTVANKVDAALQSASDFPQAAADKVWASPGRTLAAFGFSVTVATNNDKTGYRLDPAQTLPASPTAGTVGAALAQADRLAFDGANYVHAHTKLNDDKAGYSAAVTALAVGLADTLADALLDRSDGVEPGFTPRQALRLVLSALAARLAGAGGPVVVIRDVNDLVNRITATVDDAGNRLAVTLDAG